MQANGSEASDAGYVALLCGRLGGQQIPSIFDIPADDEDSAVAQGQLFASLRLPAMAASGLAERVEIWRVREVDGVGQLGDPKQFVCAWDLVEVDGRMAARMTRTYTDMSTEAAWE